MNRFTTITLLAGALWLFPATGSANGINQFFLSTPTGTTSGGNATIDWTSLTYGAANAGAGTLISGTFVEIYTYTAGTATLTFSQTNSADALYEAGSYFLKITETGLVSDPVPTTGTFTLPASLYGGSVSMSLASDFASDLSVGTSLTGANVASQTLTLVDQFTAGTVSSAVANVSFSPTPEPATFSMFGLALLSGIVVSRRKLRFSHCQK